MKILFYIYIYTYYKNSLIAKKKSNNRIFQLKYTKEQFEKSNMQKKAVNIKIPQISWYFIYSFYILVIQNLITAT